MRLLKSILVFMTLLAACTRASAPAPETEAETEAETESVTEPAPQTEPVTEALEGFSKEEQRAGERTDGLTLRAVTVETGEEFHRLLFELDGDVVPSTLARLDEDRPAILVEMTGVRFDETGNRPLLNEMGQPFGEPVKVEASPIDWYGRRQVLDDSRVDYEIRLSREAVFRLHSTTDPLRIMVDIEAGGS